MSFLSAPSLEARSHFRSSRRVMFSVISSPFPPQRLQNRVGEHSKSAAMTVAITAPASAALPGDMPLRRRHRPPAKQAGLSLPALCPERPSNQPKR